MLEKFKTYSTSNYIPVVILTCFFAYMIYSLYEQNKKDKIVEKYGHFVIGKVIRITGVSGGQMLDYYYDFANQKMYNTKQWNLGLKSVGKKFLVQVLPYSPEEGRLLVDYPIPDNFILKQPDSGWVKNPLQ